MSVCTLRLVSPATAPISFAHRSSNILFFADGTLNRANRRKLEKQNRTFFDFANVGNKNKNYARKELVGYSMEQMFSVVSDVENYNKFVPFCNKSVILTKSPKKMKADMSIGFPPINERYTSHVTLERPYLVRAECIDGRLFNYLLTHWRFSPGLQSNPQSCIVDFRVSFEFKSLLHSHLTNIFFDKVVLQMEGAFYKEVARRYGKAKIPPQVINPLKS